MPSYAYKFISFCNIPLFGVVPDLQNLQTSNGIFKNFSAACFEQKKTLHGLFTACSRPPIFHGQKFFSTAGFELLGREHGHLATLLFYLILQFVPANVVSL
jgi:hypothetical protein